MAVSGAGQSLDTTTPLFFPTDPGRDIAAVDPGEPTGFVAPTAWAYAQFNNIAPRQWERGWYQGKSATTATATHSLLAFPRLYVVGTASANVIKPARIIEAGTATGIVQLIGAASGVRGRIGTASATVHLLPGRLLLGRVADAGGAAGDLTLDGHADAFPAAPGAASGSLTLTGTAQSPEVRPGGRAIAAVRVGGVAEVTRGHLAIPQAAPIRLTGVAKATVAPPMQAVGRTRLTGAATALLTHSPTASGRLALKATAKAAYGAPAQASGTIILTAREAIALASQPGRITLSGATDPTQHHQAKAAGVLRVQPISAAARQSGEPVASGTVRLLGRIWEAHEAAALPGHIEVKSGQIKATSAPGAATLGTLALTGLALADVAVTGQTDGTLALTGEALAEVRAVATAITDPATLTLVGEAQAETAEGHKARGDITLTGVADALTATSGQGVAVLSLWAAGEGAITTPPVEYGIGDATFSLLAQGFGRIPVHLDRPANAWIILRGTGEGASTVRSGNGILARITLRAYGTSLSRRLIRPHIAMFRADKWLINIGVRPGLRIRHAALDTAVSMRADATRITNRSDQVGDVATRIEKFDPDSIREGDIP